MAIRGYHGRSHRADKMLPVGTAHAGRKRHVFVMAKWVTESLGDTTNRMRKEFKRRHRKKSRGHGKKVMEEQMRESYRPSADTVS